MKILILALVSSTVMASESLVVCGKAFNHYADVVTLKAVENLNVEIQKMKERGFVTVSAPSLQGIPDSRGAIACVTVSQP